MTDSVALLATVLFVAGLGIGCKGKTTIQDNPETAEKLEKCETSLKTKTEYINTLNERIVTLESGGATAADESPIIVNIEGALEIKAGKDKGPHGRTKDPKGNAKDGELYSAFVKEVKRSRGAIKKCYQSALKKNSALSTKSVRLQISVDFRTSGKVKRAGFSPKVSDQFNTCMSGVAQKWQLPAMPAAIRFSYTQTLTPN